MKKSEYNRKYYRENYIIDPPLGRRQSRRTIEEIAEIIFNFLKSNPGSTIPTICKSIRISHTTVRRGLCYLLGAKKVRQENGLDKGGKNRCVIYTVEQ